MFFYQDINYDEPYENAVNPSIKKGNENIKSENAWFYVDLYCIRNFHLFSLVLRRASIL